MLLEPRELVDSWETPTLLQPGQEYAMRIEMFPCSNWFAPFAANTVYVDQARPSHVVLPLISAADGP
jgi:hypothetical protein